MINIPNPVEKLQAELAQSKQTLSKLTQQDQKLDSNIKQLKQAIEKKMNKANKTNAATIDEEKIEKQLEKELENAKAKLKQYHNELKAQTKNTSTRAANTLQDLFALEQQVKQKDQEIKTLHEEIRTLTNVKRKQQKLLESKDKLTEEGSGNKVAKLAQQIRGLKEVLSNLQVNVVKKKEGLEKKQKQIAQLQQKYRSTCEKNGQRPITFEQFKERKKERKPKEDDKKDHKKQYMSIKDIINNKDNYDSLEPTQENYEQLKAKRDIAENALKNARKKHERQIEQLNKKLIFLKEQNEMLEGRLKEKEKEKQMAESRFSQTRKNTIRKLTPLK